MINFLLVGLIIVPIVLSFSLYPIFPDAQTDFRLTKELFALVLCAGLFGYSAWSQRLKPIFNRALLILLGYMCIHRFLMPKFSIHLFQTDIGAFWIYKPLFVALVMFGFYWAVSSLVITEKNYVRILKTIGWVGFLYAFIVCTQHFGISEFSKVKDMQWVQITTSAEATGFSFHPNYAGSFIALCILPMVYLRQWLAVVFMALAVFYTGSLFAGAGLVAGLVGYLYAHKASIRPIANKILTSGFILAAGAVFAGAIKMPQDNGRFAVWAKLWHDYTSPFMDGNLYMTYGYGLGSYRYIWVTQNQSTFVQAHNEFLEFLYNGGWVGLGLLIFSIFWLIRGVLSITIEDEQRSVLTGMFICMCIMACGLFVWQVEPHRIYTVLIAGLLTNKIIKGVST